MKLFRIFFLAIVCVFAVPAFGKIPVTEPEIVITDRVPVKSSNIKTVGFASNVLEIEFHSGKVYQYSGVSINTYNKLMNAPSKGKFFNKYIKGQYKVLRIN